MAMLRPQFTTSDRSSANSLTRGQSRSAEFCCSAFPEANDKRTQFQVMNANRLPVIGATPHELVIDGVPSFRFRLAQSSVVFIRGVVTYMGALGGNAETFAVSGSFTNVNGTLAALGTVTVTKTSTTAAALAVTVDQPTQSLVFTATGIVGAGDGHWRGDFTVTESTEIG